jgi:hypothetical protein
MTSKKSHTSRSVTEKRTGALGFYSHSKQTTTPEDQEGINIRYSLPDSTISIRADTNNWDNRLQEFLGKLAWALGSTWGLPYNPGTLAHLIIESNPDWVTLVLDFQEVYEKALHAPAIYDEPSQTWYRAGIKLR